MVGLAPGLKRLPGIIAIMAVPLLLAGCKTFALDDGVSNAAPKAVVVGPQDAPAPVALTKKDTGTYPTFSAPLTAANTQIGDAEATTSETQLSRLAAARASGAMSEAEYQRRIAELRRLAAQHATDTESQIAN
ncbi:SHOCT domain-containing protein [Rhizobium sp. CSW-27]|uniref:SHOCT domain-containing protein n=1 Tax=Rhizobium sp. CSW-27 TaxID=2839985 RepID=UPI002078B180|nr:SHOCT domain-containing protein [Rhizobium sp. CSW-27]